MSARRREAEQRREQAVIRLCQQLELPRSLPRLEHALIHPSFSNEQQVAQRLDNQRLEFLGDAVLGLCVSELLMECFSAVDEGDLTVMRASLVNTEALAEVARKLDLGAALQVGRGADVAGERHRTNVLADALEAVVGAVYLDGGLARARELSAIIVADRLAELRERGGIERDAKSRLQEWLQARALPPPQYRVVRTAGPPHARVFEVEVEVERASGAPWVAGAGNGRSKKLAERTAAQAALSVLEDEAEPSESG